MTISPDTLRRRLLANKQTIKAVLGDGQGRISVRGRTGEVWVRVESGVDDAGNTTYGPPFAARHKPGATYQARSGFPVRIGLDDDDQLAVVNADFEGAVGLGVDMAAYNPGNQYANQITNLNNVSYLRSYAPATSTTPTTEIAVQQFNYQASDGTYTTFRPAPTDRIDLATYAPGTAGQKRLVCIYLDTVNNALGVTQGTTKASSVAFTHAADVAEVINACPVSAIPVAVWSIENGQTTVTGDNLYYDARQWISTPDRVVISTSDPTVNDDVGSGYARWQRWVNTTDDGLFICADNTGGAAVWTEVGAGGSGLSSFDITDGTTTDTVDSTDDTITFASSSTVEATVSATNTVVHEVPDGSLSVAKLSFTPLQSFTIFGDTGLALINQGDDITFGSGGSLTTNVNGFTNEVGINIASGGVDTPQLANDAVTNAKIAANAVDTAEIADDAVSLAKIESVSGNAGYFVGYDDAGDPAALAGMVHLHTFPITGGGSISITGLNGAPYDDFDDLVFYLYDIKHASGTGNASLIVNINGLTGGHSRNIYNYSAIGVNTEAFGLSSSLANAFVLQNETLSGCFHLYDVHSSNDKYSTGHFVSSDGTSDVVVELTSGRANVSSAITSLQISYSNGIISATSDRIEIFGLKHG